MTLLKRLIGELFGTTEDISPKDEQLIREKITPTDFFLVEYEQWYMAGMHLDLLQRIREQKALKESNPDAESIYFTHRSDASNGFYFLSEETWSNKDYAFISQLFVQRLKELGYVLNNSRRDVKEKDGVLICSENFYFKLPLATRTQKPIPQMWGNVILQHHSIDDRSKYVKLMANVYNDRSYQTAKDFEELEELILASNPIY